MRWDPKPKIRDKVVKVNWDASKSPAANLAVMGLLARPNTLTSSDHNAATTTTAPSKAHVIELFDVPESDRPSRQTRFPLTAEEEAYMARGMAKYGDDYTAMFRDTKRTNDMQYTEDKLRKMGARFLLLSSAQRRVPVPEKVQALLPHGEEGA